MDSTHFTFIVLPTARIITGAGGLSAMTEMCVHCTVYNIEHWAAGIWIVARGRWELVVPLWRILVNYISISFSGCDRVSNFQLSELLFKILFKILVKIQNSKQQTNQQ